MGESRFPSPFELEPPQDVEGWEELYPYCVQFGGGRREYEDNRFWFWDSMHWGTAMTPWESTILEMAIVSLSQFNSRHYRIPPADGIDFRVLYGYPFFSPVTIEDGARIEARVPEFLERAGFYFANWDSLYENWLGKVKANIDDINAVDFSPLPEVEDLAVITSGLGTGSGHRLLSEYHRFKDLCLKVWQYHFEFLNLGYAAYLDFFGFCKQAFPSIPDLGIAKMVAGVEVDLFRPNEELKGLATKAVELGIADVFDAAADPAKVRAALEDSEAGRTWQAAWDAVREPWFNFSSGTGFYHDDKTWADHPEIPYGFIRDYIAKIRDGVDITRPIEAIRAERDRVVEEYAELLPTDEDRAAFESKLGLARVVFPYVENHNFYIEHWTMSAVWRKLRELRRHAGEGRRQQRCRRRLLLPPRRDGRGAVRRLHGLGDERADRRADVLARAHRPAPPDRGQLQGLAATEGPRRAAHDRDGALHDHAVGHHQRFDPGLARLRRRRWRGPVGHGCVTGRGRRRRPARVRSRRHRPGRRRRHPRGADHGPELGAGLPQDPGLRDRHRRDDVACRHRVQGVRRPGGDRDGVRYQPHRHRAAHPRRRQRRHGHGARVTTIDHDEVTPC